MLQCAVALVNALTDTENEHLDELLSAEKVRYGYPFFAGRNVVTLTSIKIYYWANRKNKFYKRQEELVNCKDFILELKEPITLSLQSQNSL